MRWLMAVSYCICFVPLLLSDSYPNISKIWLLALGREMKSSTPLLITFCCLISATIPILIDIFFDLVTSFHSKREKHVSMKATKNIHTFVGERFNILVGMVVTALINVVLILDSDISAQTVGLININCIAGECFWILGIIFTIGEAISVPGLYLKHYLGSLVLCIIMIGLIHVYFFTSNGGGPVCLFFIFFVSGCVILHFTWLYRTTLGAYLSSSASNPNSLEAQNTFTLLIYQTFGILYTLGKRLINYL